MGSETSRSTRRRSTGHRLNHDETVRLRIALGRIGRTLRQVKTESTDGLTFPETSILLNVQRSEPVKLGDLAVTEGLAPPSVTRTVRSLESKGLIRRASDPEDGRVVIIKLTRKGERLCSRIRESRDEWLMEVADRLTEEQVASLLSALEALEALSLAVREMEES